MRRCAILFLLFPLPYLYLAFRTAGAFGFFNVLNPTTQPIFIEYLVVYLAATLIFCYGLYRVLRDGMPALRVILFIFLLTSASAILITPSSSCDLYYYVSHSVIQGKYGLNPYLTTINSMPGDGAASFSATSGYPRDTPMTYGYVFAMGLKLLYAVAAGHEEVIYILLKVMNIVFLYFTFLFLQKIARHFTGRPREILSVLFLLNPVVIIQYVINGHNDALICLFISMGLYYLFTNRYIPAVLSMIFALHTKAPAVFIIPFVILYAFKARMPLWQILVGIVFLLLSFLPYKLVYHLHGLPLGISTYRMSVDASFPLAAMYILSFFRNITENLFLSAMRAFFFIWVAVYVINLFLYGGEKGSLQEKIGRYGERIYLLYVAFFSYVIFPWYFLWLVPFIGWAKDKGRRFLMYSAIFMWGEMYYSFLYPFTKAHLSYYYTSILIFYSVSVLIYILFPGLLFRFFKKMDIDELQGRFFS